MPNEPKKKSGLNLNRENIKKTAPISPEEAATQMGQFYETLGNCLLNLVAIQNDIAKSMREISVDTSFILENLDKKGVSEGWLTEADLAEREGPDDEEERPANAQ
jgi:hypothetical protein